MPISGEELNSHSNHSSIILASSTTQDASPYDNLVKDLRKEIQTVASTVSDPILQAVYQYLERLMPNVTSRQTDLVLKEEEPNLELDNETEDVTSNTETIPQNSNLYCDVSLVKKQSQRRPRKRGKFTASKSKTLFGTFYLRSEVYEDRGVPHSENFYMFHPANWLVLLGMKSSFDVMISRSTQGWTNNLSSRTFRAVPHDALIFQFCENGNLEGIKTLLARGDASLMDRCPRGWTLLHVSIIFFGFCVFLPSYQEVGFVSVYNKL